MSVESPDLSATSSDRANHAPSDAGGPQVERLILGSPVLGVLLDAKFYLASVFIGFLICSIAGYYAGLSNQFGNIHRFGITLGPQAAFFPTIRQLISFARSDSSSDKIFVIVGGSSILNGVGQSSEQLWTRSLQSRLGSKYKVVNLGLRSCSSYEGAYFVAEAMQRQGSRVIFITGSSPALNWNPLGKPTYAHLYWDGKYHNLFYDFPLRDSAIATQEQQLPDADWTREELNELKLSRRFNSAFHFLDLWNAVGFRYFYTMYNPITQRLPLAPLKKLFEIEGYENFPQPEQKLAMDSIKGESLYMYTWNNKTSSWVEQPEAWSNFVETIKTNVAPELRKCSVVLLLHHNPQYVAQLTSTEKDRDILAYEKAKKTLEEQGVAAVQSCDSFEPADFRDTKHLATSGGVKLSIQVARIVKNMAKGLGYDR